MTVSHAAAGATGFAGGAAHSPLMVMTGASGATSSAGAASCPFLSCSPDADEIVGAAGAAECICVHANAAINTPTSQKPRINSSLRSDHLGSWGIEQNPSTRSQSNSLRAWNAAPLSEAPSYSYA